MAVQFAVVHVSKGKGGGSGLQKHIDRDTTPKNADPEKAHLNEIEDFSHLGKTLGARADTVIAKAKLERKVRKDAVKYCPIILTGSHEAMTALTEDQLKDWKDTCKMLVEEKYGKENIISFALHRDERTPHIHAVVVPLHQGTNKKGEEVTKLSARDLFNKEALTELQDQYGFLMEQWGMIRGREGSKAEHKTVRQFYNELPSEIHKLKAEIGYKNEAIEMKAQDLERVSVSLDEKIKEMQAVTGDLESKKAKLAELEELQKQYSAVSSTKKILKGAGDRLLGGKAKLEEENKALKEQVQGLTLKVEEGNNVVNQMHEGLKGLVASVNEELKKAGSRAEIARIVEKGSLVYRVHTPFDAPKQGDTRNQNQGRGKSLGL